ncbi:MAG TPA: nitrite reductase small subunit NirD [Pseudomonas sp.]|jgi:nitrite reductase (NADH) small subunit|uniref:nitrite reductase small subunit NirD n=1 Tax=Pseudomonas sp. TaxID=306 RepID=UPI002BA1CB1D|nr:nitrite reductase small subunit NirD [Pseudomonas sp.]HTO18571.1 nitrite reductase small subunit NirD [Pseudomonas sp.]
MNMYAPLHAETALQWRALCSRRDLVAHSGVVAWLEGTQVALFHLPGDQVYAVENRDPRSGANVIGRGIVGSLKGQTVVAAPLYKQHFRLDDGLCLEDPQQRLRVWPARLNGDAVEIALG